MELLYSCEGLCLCDTEFKLLQLAEVNDAKIKESIFLKRDMSILSSYLCLVEFWSNLMYVKVGRTMIYSAEECALECLSMSVQ